MKIRNGFVSNSSSSSYVVKIRDTYWNEFCDEVVASKGFDMKDELLKKINDDIARFEKYVAESDGKGEIFRGMHQDRLANLNEWKLALGPEKVNSETLVEIALKFSGIKRHESNKDVVELAYLTSMHNSFNDGMDELLKEIVLLFLFDTKKRIECERESYGE